jgi:hypothetical protein
MLPFASEAFPQSVAPPGVIGPHHTWNPKVTPWYVRFDQLDPNTVTVS